jgi:methionyl-tRNA synthetase
MNIFPLENPKAVIIILVLTFAWTIPWKALALWKSARHGQAGWFVLFILVNTLGLLEIIYLKFFSRVGFTDLEEPKVNLEKPKTSFLPPKELPSKVGLKENPRKILMRNRMHNSLD